MNASASPTFARVDRTTLDELVRLKTLANAQAFATRRRSNANQIGPAVSRRLGRGLDFAEVREYQAGDDVRMIDWKVTARTGQAHTKLFVEERDRPVLLLVDHRRAMHFATRGVFKSAQAERLAALVGWHAVQAGDRVGGWVVKQPMLQPVRAQSGRRGLMALFRALQGEAVNPTEDLPWAHVLRTVDQNMDSGAVVWLFSDGAGWDEAASQAFAKLARRASIRWVQVADALDRTLPPPGAYSLVAAAGTTLKLQLGESRQQREWAARFEQHTTQLERLCLARHHRHHLIMTDDTLPDAFRSILGASA